MNIMTDLPPIIGRNILAFDWIVFVFAIINLFYYIFSRRLAIKIYELLRPEGFLPEDDGVPSFVVPTKKELVKMRERVNNRYTIFINITSIFPLLGILGTVVSLIPMVPEIDTMKQNFLVALTSTLWGLVFSIIYKLLDGSLASRIEDNVKTIDLYLAKKKPEAAEATAAKH